MGGPGSGVQPDTFDTADAAIAFLVPRLNVRGRITQSDVNAMQCLILEYRRAERMLDAWVEEHGPRRPGRAAVRDELTRWIT
jgi:hypothetical protein